MEHVSPKQKEQLDALAETLMLARQVGSAAVQLEGVQLVIEFDQPQPQEQEPEPQP